MLSIPLAAFINEDELNQPAVCFNIVKGRLPEIRNMLGLEPDVSVSLRGNGFTLVSNSINHLELIDYEAKTRPLPVLGDEGRLLADSRLSICKACDKYDSLQRTCTLCGCQMSFKVNDKNAKCPLNKWVVDETI